MSQLWSLKGEGNANVVFAYSGDDPDLVSALEMCEVSVCRHAPFRRSPAADHQLYLPPTQQCAASGYESAHMVFILRAALHVRLLF